MPRRYRHATGDELVSLLADDDLDTELVSQVINRLAELGAPVDDLIRITVDEPLRR
jgi:hypothetical protein